jgi:hypothetical protein
VKKKKKKKPHAPQIRVEARTDIRKPLNFGKAVKASPRKIHELTTASTLQSVIPSQSTDLKSLQIS